MNTEKKAIETLRTYLNEQKQNEKRITINEMIYNDEVEKYEDAPGYDSMPELPSENQPGGEASGENAPIEKALPSEQRLDPEILEMFANIRHSVLLGLQKLEKKPYSTEYDLLRKLLQLIDKPIDTANKEK